MTAGTGIGSGFRKLGRRAEFLNAARGRRAGRTAFTLQAVDAESPLPGLGLTVTKKIGNAPERNRVKRRLRAAARACGGTFLPQHDYVLVGRREALTLPFEKIVSDLNSAIGKVHAQERAKGTPDQ
ncbi:MAG TPA: ribonuclease P protein component [Devosia sp.]|nr:ribonuclease P protein component [Devosia sp.]